MAVNCWFVPFAMLGLTGVTAIDTSTAGPTFTAMVPEIAPDVALTCATPWAAPVSRPPAVTVATDVFEDDHVAVLVMSTVLPSEYVPVAVSCCVVPLAIVGFAGVTEIETRTAGLTVRVVLPLTEPEVALICEVP